MPPFGDVQVALRAELIGLAEELESEDPRLLEVLVKYARVMRDERVRAESNLRIRKKSS